MADRGDDYLRLVRVVSSLLYAYDPDGMGLTASAPSDEYDEFAARLVVTLVKFDTDAETAAHLRGEYRDGEAGLVDGITAAVGLFRRCRGAAA